MDTEKIKLDALQQLERQVLQAQKSDLAQPLTLTFLYDDHDKVVARIKGWVKEKKYSAYIYVFRLEDNSMIPECSMLFNNAKEEAKSKDIKRAYAKDNKDNKLKHRALYVGSSKSIVSRVRQHLGLVSKSTYSMQMSTWLKNTDINVILDIYPCAFEDQFTLQLFEDTIWDSYAPALGKKGGR